MGEQYAEIGLRIRLDTEKRTALLSAETSEGNALTAQSIDKTLLDAKRIRSCVADIRIETPHSILADSLGWVAEALEEAMSPALNQTETE